MDKTIRIDRLRLIERMSQSFIYVDYKMGSKPPLGGIPGINFTTADCSGYLRWLIWAASYGKTKLPLGSWHQRVWCQKQGFKPVVYKDVAMLEDSRLRVAFTNPRSSHAGHTWLVINAQSIESYGGHGAGRRDWDTPVLLNNADWAFVLTQVLI